MGIKHSFTSPKIDGPDTNVVRPSDWNANHTIDSNVDFNGYSIDNAIIHVIQDPAPKLANNLDLNNFQFTFGSQLDGVGSGVADIRQYGAVWTGGSYTGVTAAVEAAVAAGFTKVFLPANCTYVPTANTTPDNVEIIGEDWNTSIISVANRATDNLFCGAKGKLVNVGIISLFGDSVVTPVINKTCPVGVFYNQSDSVGFVGVWMYQPVVINTGVVTSPDGHTGTDVPAFAIAQLTSGDGIFLGLQGTGSTGVRINCAGVGDTGMLIYSNGGTDPHTQIRLNEVGTSPNSKGLYIQRETDGPINIYYEETTAGPFTSNLQEWFLNHQSSGSFIRLSQAITPYSGDLISLDTGAAGGTFTGTFLKCTVANALRFAIYNNGVVVGQTASGPLGAGTINTQGDIYKDGSPYTNPDYALEHWATGKIEKFKDNRGANSYQGRVPLEKLEAKLKANLRLPGMHDNTMGAFERSEILLEKLEEAYTYIVDLHNRLASLEK